jgi:small-conductance mechanosensitive channel
MGTNKGFLFFNLFIGIFEQCRIFKTRILGLSEIDAGNDCYRMRGGIFNPSLYFNFRLKVASFLHHNVTVTINILGLRLDNLFHEKQPCNPGIFYHLKMKDRRSIIWPVSIIIFVLATITVALYAISALFMVRKFMLADYLMVIAWVGYDPA